MLHLWHSSGVYLLPVCGWFPQGIPGSVAWNCWLQPLTSYSFLFGRHRTQYLWEADLRISAAADCPESGRNLLNWDCCCKWLGYRCDGRTWWVAFDWAWSWCFRQVLSGSLITFQACWDCFVVECECSSDCWWEWLDWHLLKWLVWFVCWCFWWWMDWAAWTRPA